MFRILFYISIVTGAFLLFTGCPTNPGAGQGSLQVVNNTQTNIFNISYAGVAIGIDVLPGTNAPGLVAGDYSTISVNSGSAYLYFTAMPTLSGTYQNYVTANQVTVSGGLTTFYYIQPSGNYNLALVKMGDQNTIIPLVPVK